VLPLRSRNEERGILFDVRNSGALERTNTVHVSQNQQLDAISIQELQTILADLFQLLNNNVKLDRHHKCVL
jgi:hypothetical protein